MISQGHYAPNRVFRLFVVHSVRDSLSKNREICYVAGLGLVSKQIFTCEKKTLLRKSAIDISVVSSNVANYYLSIFREREVVLFFNLKLGL